MGKAPYNLLSSKRDNMGFRLHSSCLGRDPECVNIQKSRPKSMGHSKVLPPATTDINKVRGVMYQLTSRLTRRLRNQEFVVEQVVITLATKTTAIKKLYKFQNQNNCNSDFIEFVDNHL